MLFGRSQLLRSGLLLTLLLLSAAVFNWGLQYKLSLYHADGGVHTFAAKFWTGRTGVTIVPGTAVDQNGDKADVVPLVLLIALVPAAMDLLFGAFLELLPKLVPARPRGLKSAFFPYLFLRPPPPVCFAILT